MSLCALNLMKFFTIVASATEGNEGCQVVKEVVVSSKGEDVSNGGDEAEPMSIDDQPATLTTDESVAKVQPQDVKMDDNKPVVFSIGPTPLPTIPPTNADKQMDNGPGVRPGPVNIALMSTAFQTNADIPKEMMEPPFSAPPIHRQHAPTVGKQLSTPLLSNVIKGVIPEAANEPQHVFSQISETAPKHEYLSQMSYVDLPLDLYPTQKVSTEDEAAIQRQQQRFKRIEEQNKTKPLQFKQTYSDPYSYRSAERVQAKQRRGQG